MMKSATTKYVLTMTEKQARCVVAALDLSTRILLGQWKEIIECCMDYEPGEIDEWCQRRDEAEEILLKARDIVMPELADMHSLSGGHGVYANELTERAYNVLLAVRSCIAYYKNPEGGYTVNFHRPMAMYVAEEMPRCEVVEDERQDSKSG